MRRLACLVSAAAAISLAAAALPRAAGADPASCQPGAGPLGGDPSTAGGVNIHTTANHAVVWCSAAVIEANSDVPDGTNYPLRATSQSPNYNPVSNAISVSALLTLAGVNPASVNHTEIARLSGGWSSLTTADLVDPATRFADGLKPIVWINGAETQYLRPLRDASDTNGDDQIVVSDGQALDLFLYSGPLLTVRAEATPARAAVKQPVTFTARVVNPSSANGALTYRWTFQDGSTATGASVTHAYAVAGTWHPVVTVQGAGNDSGGASEPIAVTVGSLPKRSTHGRPGGTQHTKHASGPTQSAGKTANSTPTPQSAGKTANSTPTPQSGGKTTDSTDSTPTPKGTSAPAATPSPVRRVPSVPSAPAAPHGTPTPHRVVQPHSTPRRRRAVSRTRVRHRHAPGTMLVSGRLLADVVPISAAELTRGSGGTRRQAAPAAPGGGAPTPVGAIAGGLAFVLLLGSGAGRELRAQGRT